MKRICCKLTAMLVAIPVLCFAQAPKTAATPPSAPPAATSPAAAPAQQPATAPQTAGSAINTGGPIDPNRYVIGAQDSLQITVWKDATLSGTVPVRPDGMISMNLVGDLRAAGLTPMALAADIGQRLKSIFRIR